MSLNVGTAPVTVSSAVSSPASSIGSPLETSCSLATPLLAASLSSLSSSGATSGLSPTTQVGSTAARSQSALFRVFTSNEPTSTQARMLVAIGERFQKEFSEEVSSVTLLSKTAFPQDDKLPKMRDGELELSLPSIQDVAKAINDKSAEILTMNYLFNKYSDVDAVWQGAIGTTIREQVLKSVHVYLPEVIHFGVRRITTSNETPVQKPADLENVLLRMPKPQAWLEAGYALGGNEKTVVPLEVTKVIKAFQDKAITAQEQPLTSIKGQNVPISRVYLTNHRFDFLLVAISGRFFDSLSSKAQTGLLTIVADEAKKYNNLIEEEDSKILESLGDKVVKVDLEAFEKHSFEYYSKAHPALFLPGSPLRQIRPDFFRRD